VQQPTVFTSWLFPVADPMSSENILVGNMRGLNSITHCNALRSLVAVERPSVVCLQETMLAIISDFDIMQLIGPGFDYYFLSSV
jgi:hypothetical protein